eukprot:CAMPEP_0185850818 /NCGR_PEP_ID=MMETSP1354-20130828/4809_1 /TAXON_ID=708628 /ORGANISM="Erythrolobus madagascarensis, Strain CCMP3276" /LENGTH=500 /DNA_ID=CAMNT_0028551543 /DNA_START=191 /DNA_END=1693 /DNA_ORIENTATION=+
MIRNVPRTTSVSVLSFVALLVVTTTVTQVQFLHSVQKAMARSSGTTSHVSRTVLGLQEDYGARAATTKYDTKWADKCAAGDAIQTLKNSVKRAEDFEIFGEKSESVCVRDPAVWKRDGGFGRKSLMCGSGSRDLFLETNPSPKLTTALEELIATDWSNAKKVEAIDPETFMAARVGKTRDFGVPSLRWEMIAPHGLTPYKISVRPATERGAVGTLTQGKQCDSKKPSVVLTKKDLEAYPHPYNLAHHMMEVTTLFSAVHSWRDLRIPKPTHVVWVAPTDRWDLGMAPFFTEARAILEGMLKQMDVELIDGTSNVDLCATVFEFGTGKSWFPTAAAADAWYEFAECYNAARGLAPRKLDNDGDIVLFNRSSKGRGFRNEGWLLDKLRAKYPKRTVRVVQTGYGEDITTQVSKLHNASLVITGHGMQASMALFLPKTVSFIEVLPSTWASTYFVPIYYASGRKYGIYLDKCRDGRKCVFDLDVRRGVGQSIFNKIDSFLPTK